MDWQARAEAVEHENERLRDRIAALEEALGLTRDYAPALGLNLTRTEGQMVGMLLARGFVKRESFMAALYQTRPDSDDPPDVKIIDVLICKLRPKVKAISGATIETKWGEGYFIPAAQKGALRQAIEGRAA